jgi:hypothetical protein
MIVVTEVGGWKRNDVGVAELQACIVSAGVGKGEWPSAA